MSFSPSTVNHDGLKPILQENFFALLNRLFSDVDTGHRQERAANRSPCSPSQTRPIQSRAYDCASEKHVKTPLPMHTLFPAPSVFLVVFGRFFGPSPPPVQCPGRMHPPEKNAS